MSNSNQSSIPPSTDSSSGRANFQSIIASNSSNFNSELMNTIKQDHSPRNIDSTMKVTNDSISSYRNSSLSNELTTTMLMDEVTSSAYHHDYDHNTMHSNSFGGGKKRSRILSASDGKVEDILSQICNEMDKLTTSDNSNEDKISAFIQVLQCAHDEASFYLESSAWNVETAVMLWLDNHDTINTYTSSVSTYRDRSVHERNYYTTRNGPDIYPGKQWKAREVTIEGLDPEWSAHVNPRTGQIYFIHKLTGYQQSSVPPGFADIPPVFRSSNSRNHDRNRNRSHGRNSNHDRSRNPSHDNDSLENLADREDNIDGDDVDVDADDVDNNQRENEDDDNDDDDNDDDNGEELINASAGDLIVEAEAVLINVHPYHPNMNIEDSELDSKHAGMDDLSEI